MSARTATEAAERRECPRACEAATAAGTASKTTRCSEQNLISYPKKDYPSVGGVVGGIVGGLGGLFGGILGGLWYMEQKNNTAPGVVRDTSVEPSAPTATAPLAAP